LKTAGDPLDILRVRGILLSSDSSPPTPASLSETPFHRPPFQPSAVFYGPHGGDTPFLF